MTLGRDWAAAFVGLSLSFSVRHGTQPRACCLVAMASPLSSRTREQAPQLLPTRAWHAPGADGHSGHSGPCPALPRCPRWVLARPEVSATLTPFRRGGRGPERSRHWTKAAQLVRGPG